MVVGQKTTEEWRERRQKYIYIVRTLLIYKNLCLIAHHSYRPLKGGSRRKRRREGEEEEEEKDETDYTSKLVLLPFLP